MGMNYPPAWRLVTNEPGIVQRVYALLRLSDLIMPDVEMAESYLREALKLLPSLTLPQLRFRVRQRLGSLYLLQGREDEAEPLLAHYQEPRPRRAGPPVVMGVSDPLIPHVAIEAGTVAEQLWARFKRHLCGVERL